MTNNPRPKDIQSIIPTGNSIDCHAIFTHTTTDLSKPTLNHSLRVYLLAQRIQKQQTPIYTNPQGKQERITVDPEQLFTACMFHDMGTSSSQNGPQRFEVEGADAAVAFLAAQNVTDADVLRSIWCAVALHTSAGVAERIGPLNCLVRVAVKADFAVAVRDGLGLAEYAAEIESYLPRMGVERCLAEEVVAQATRGEKEQGLYAADGNGRWNDSAKFPKASWPGVLLRAYLEKVDSEGVDWQGPNPAF